MTSQVMGFIKVEFRTGAAKQYCGAADHDSFRQELRRVTDDVVTNRYDIRLVTVEIREGTYDEWRGTWGEWRSHES